MHAYQQLSHSGAILFTIGIGTVCCPIAHGEEIDAALAKRLAETQPIETQRQRHADLMTSYNRAAEAGDVETLIEALKTQDVESRGDAIFAARKLPVEKKAAFLRAVMANDFWGMGESQVPITSMVRGQFHDRTRDLLVAVLHRDIPWGSLRDNAVRAKLSEELKAFEANPKGKVGTENTLPKADSLSPRQTSEMKGSAAVPVSTVAPAPRSGIWPWILGLSSLVLVVLAAKKSKRAKSGN